MVNSQAAALLLTSGLVFTTAVPIGINGWYDCIQNVFKSISDQLPSHKPKPFLSTSIVSLIPKQEYESWISSERDIAFESIIKNIGGWGQDEVMTGAVIASPSKSHPDYFYQVSTYSSYFCHSLALLHPHSTQILIKWKDVSLSHLLVLISHVVANLIIYSGPETPE